MIRTVEICFFLSLLLFVSGSLANAEIYSVKSPDEKNEIRLHVETEVRYSVLRDGEMLVAPTGIDLDIEGKGTLASNPVVVSHQTETLEGILETKFYKKSQVDLAGHVLNVTFDDHRQIELRAYNDGVAYRFVTDFPEEIIVSSETGGAALPKDVRGFFPYDHDAYQGDYFQGNWENVYNAIRVSEIDPERLVYTPITFRIPQGPCFAFSEANLQDYPGMNLVRPYSTADSIDEPLLLQAVFAKVPKDIEPEGCQVRVRSRENYIAKTAGTRHFPWRCFFIAEKEHELLNSDLVIKLTDPCRIEDTSWIRPGKAVWDWWEDGKLIGVDFQVGFNTNTYKEYIDFAAANKLEYVLFDAGWAVYTSLFDIKPEIDMQILVDYAKERNVDIILWCPFAQFYGYEEKLFEFHSQLGIKGFKIDFFDRDDQKLEQFLHNTAELAAKYQMVLLYHGMHKPAGLQFIWPNVLNCEGVFGQEVNKFYEVDQVRNDTIIPFTRMLSGALDYTPGTMRNATKDNHRVNYHFPSGQGTRSHQMAICTLFEAPITVFSDVPSTYRKEQECFDYLASLPTVWDDTIGIDGKIGEYVVLARRSGKTWYLVAVGNWKPQTLNVSLTFLESGPYQAEIYQDGINADKHAVDYKKRTDIYHRTDIVNIHLAPGGGWTGCFTPMGDEISK